MLQIILLILGVIALTKGEIEATPSRKISAESAKIIGIIFIVCSVLPLLLGGLGSALMLLIALSAAIAGIVTAK